VCIVSQRKAERQFIGSQGVSEMPSNLTKATLLKRKAGVSGMRLDEVAGHPFSGRDFGNVFGVNLNKLKFKYFLKS